MSGRKHCAKNFPDHIDRDKLPKGIYWDSSGRGHWYISFSNSFGKQRRKRAAGPEASEYELDI